MSLISSKLASLIVIIVGTIWVYLNIFYTPFYIWSEGLYRPWLFLNGLVLFKDILWLRASFELYLLSGFYKLFGANPLSFQYFIFVIQALIGAAIYLLLNRKSKLLAIISYVVYLLSAYLIYGTINQPAEILIGLFVFLVFYFFWQFIEKKNLKFLFLAGIATGFSLITKQTSLFIPISIPILLVIFSKKEWIKKTIYYILGAAIPVILYAGYFTINGGLYDLYLNAIYNVLFLYPPTQDISLYPVDFTEAIRIVVIHLTVLIPFIFLNTKKFFPNSVKAALIVFILSLLPTLLPAYLSYRMISALPLFSMIVAIFFICGLNVLRKQKGYLMKGIIILGFLAFIIQFGKYSQQSLQYIADNGGFVRQQYRMSDYSQTEEQVAEWLKTNINKNEKVFGIGNVLIMFYGDKLPHNKYSDLISFEYYPQNISFKDITTSPARVVVYDSNTPTSMRNLKDWKYIGFLKEHYNLVKKIGSYEIYILR